MTETTKYAHAPVVLALIEIRHPRSDLSRGDAIALKNTLRSILPLHSTQDVMTRTLEITPSGPIQPPDVVTKWDYYGSRTRRTRFGCSPEATTIETTEYDTWQVLLGIIRAALAARHDLSPLDGYTRIGLRYIDEIRPPGNGGEPDWTKWITEPFRPPLPNGDELVPAQQNCVVQYRTSEPGQTVTVRFGAVNAPAAVVGELRPNPPESGPYFLVDTDVAWELPQGDAVPTLDVEVVCQKLDDLHDHASRMFEHVLTDELREELG